MITYNSDLFVILLAGYTFFNGLAWAYLSITKNGEPRKWDSLGLVDGAVLMAISAIPIFF